MSGVRKSGPRRAWIISVSIVLAVLLAAGAWWRLSGAFGRSGMDQRLADLRGVSSVRSGDDGYRVRFARSVPADRLSSALRRLTEIQADGSDVRVYADIGRVELRVDDTVEPKRAARVVASVVAADAVHDARVALDAARVVEVRVKSRRDLLKTARTILDGYVRHGVKDAGDNSYAQLIVRLADGETAPSVSAVEPKRMRKRLRLIKQTLEKSHSRLYSAVLSRRDDTIAVSVKHRDRMPRAYRTFRAALGRDDVHVTTRTNSLAILGNGKPGSALAVVRKLELPGAHVTKIARNLSRATVTVNSDDRLRRVTRRLTGKGSGGLDPAASISLSAPNTGTSIHATLDELDWVGPLAVQLRRLGFDADFEGKQFYEGKREVLRIGARRSSDRGSVQVDLHDQATRSRLIKTLRAGDWNGELLLQILGLADGDGENKWGLRFRATPESEARGVRFPGQNTATKPGKPQRSGSAADFLREWNATAARE